MTFKHVGISNEPRLRFSCCLLPTCILSGMKKAVKREVTFEELDLRSLCMLWFTVPYRAALWMALDVSDFEKVIAHQKPKKTLFIGIWQCVVFWRELKCHYSWQVGYFYTWNLGGMTTNIFGAVVCVCMHEGVRVHQMGCSSSPWLWVYPNWDQMQNGLLYPQPHAQPTFLPHDDPIMLQSGHQHILRIKEILEFGQYNRGTENKSGFYPTGYRVYSYVSRFQK